jgi:hypothetical protein
MKISTRDVSGQTAFNVTTSRSGKISASSTIPSHDIRLPACTPKSVAGSAIPWDLINNRVTRELLFASAAIAMPIPTAAVLSRVANHVTAQQGGRKFLRRT